jgi:hypothetical protein
MCQGEKQHEHQVDYSPPSTEVKDVWNYTFTSLCIILSWWFIKHGNNFAFYIYKRSCSHMRVVEKWVYPPPPLIFHTIVVMVECLIWAHTWWLKSSEHRYGDLHYRSTVEFCAMFWQMFCADNPGSSEWRLLRQLPVTLLLCDTAFCWLSPSWIPREHCLGIVRLGLLGGMAKGVGEASEPLPIHHLGKVSFR